jgi:hypothetical protein
MGPPSSFRPLAWSADPLSLKGTGAMPETHRTPIAWTADTLKLTGHP